LSQPRIITGHGLPHYVGSRPGLFTALIKLHTHPVKSTYLDNIAGNLLQQFGGVPLIKLAPLGKDINQSNSNFQGSVIKINSAGAKAVVQMAVKFGLLTENYFWSWKGHTVNIICGRERINAKSFLELDLAEKIVYLKYYLEADGAMLFTLGKQILEYPAGISTKDLFEKPFVDDAFATIIRSYLELTSNLGYRTKLRQDLSRQEAQSYKSTTRRHKLLTRLIPLEDFGLLSRKMTTVGETIVSSKQDGRVPLEVLIKDLGSIGMMEQRFTQDGFFTILANSLCHDVESLSLDKDKALLSREIAYAYVSLQDTGIAVYPLNTVKDVVCTRLLANHAVLSSPEQVMEFLGHLQKNHLNEVRFHVDRRGQPTYLILGERLLQEMTNG